MAAPIVDRVLAVFPFLPRPLQQRLESLIAPELAEKRVVLAEVDDQVLNASHPLGLFLVDDLSVE